MFLQVSILLHLLYFFCSTVAYPPMLPSQRNPSRSDDAYGGDQTAEWIQQQFFYVFLRLIIIFSPF